MPNKASNTHNMLITEKHTWEKHQWLNRMLRSQHTLVSEIPAETLHIKNNFFFSIDLTVFTIPGDYFKF